MRSSSSTASRACLLAACHSLLCSFSVCIMSASRSTGSFSASRTRSRNWPTACRWHRVSKRSGAILAEGERLPHRHMSMRIIRFISHHRFVLREPDQIPELAHCMVHTQACMYAGRRLLRNLQASLQIPLHGTDGTVCQREVVQLLQTMKAFRTDI